MLPYARPAQRLLPTPTPESSAFWTGGEQNRLLVHRCRSCRHWFHPPAPACFRCRSLEIGPEPVSGRGRIAAFTVNRQPWIPAFPPPYLVAMVEIAEQPDVRLVSNVVDLPFEDAEVGLEVAVFFEQWDDVWIPLFRPVGSGR